MMTETELKLRHYQNLLAILDSSGYIEVVYSLLDDYRRIFIVGLVRNVDAMGSGLDADIEILGSVPGVDLTGLTYERLNR